MHNKSDRDLIKIRGELVQYFLKNFNLPLRYSIHDSTVSGGSVSLICFSASSKRTSPVGVSDFNTSLLLATFFFLIPCFSNSTRPLNANSMRMHPRKPLEIQSFQNDV